MTEDKKDDSGFFDDSRRSFMKKSAAGIGASALALGGAGNAAAQNQDGGGGNVQDGASAVMFAYDYYSGADFQVISEMQQQTTANILTMGRADEEEQQGGGTGAEVFEDPFNWNGYVIQYDFGSSGLVSFLFSEEVELNDGDTATVGQDVAFRSADMNFVDVTIGSSGDQQQQQVDDDQQQQAGDDQQQQAGNETDTDGGDFGGNETDTDGGGFGDDNATGNDSDVTVGVETGGNETSE